MKKILIKNGKVILEDRIEQADVLIEDGKFIKIGNIEEECSNVLDVHGLYDLLALLTFILMEEMALII